MGTTARTWNNFTGSFVAQNTGDLKVDFQFKALGSTAADFAIDRAFVQSAVPEPTTWLMMILGFAGIGFSLRRKQHVAARIQFA